MKHVGSLSRDADKHHQEADGHDLMARDSLHALQDVNHKRMATLWWRGQALSCDRVASQCCIAETAIWVRSPAGIVALDLEQEIRRWRGVRTCTLISRIVADTLRL